MRTLLTACATSATLLAGVLASPTAAHAMPLAPVGAPRLLDRVQNFCPEVWSCGRFACGWSFVCGWRPGGYYYGPSVYVTPYRAWRRGSYRRRR